MIPRALVLLLAVGLLLLALSACTGVDGRPLAQALIEDAGAASSSPAESVSASSPSAESPSPAKAPTSKPATERAVAQGAHLLEALEYAPAAPSTIMLMDWTAVKERMGAPAASSAAGEGVRLDFGRALQLEPVVSMYGRAHFLDHAANWGWDTFDLEWEFSLTLEDAPPAYVLRFQDADTLDAMGDIFASRDFAAEMHGNAQLYTHPMDPSTDWINTTELVIHNAGVLKPARILVLSHSEATVRAIVDMVGDGATLANDPAVRAAVQQLGAVDAAIVTSGEDACLAFEVNPVLDMVGEEDVSTEAMQEHIDRIMPVRPLSLYSALAIGLDSERAADGDPIWKVVMHHPSEELAQADLAQRRIIAEQGMSSVTDAANQELFTVQDAAVEGQNAMLWLAPARENNARILIQMFLMRDLAFLACP